MAYLKDFRNKSTLFSSSEPKEQKEEPLSTVVSTENLQNAPETAEETITETINDSSEENPSTRQTVWTFLKNLKNKSTLFSSSEPKEQEEEPVATAKAPESTPETVEEIIEEIIDTYSGEDTPTLQAAVTQDETKEAPLKEETISTELVPIRTPSDTWSKLRQGFRLGHLEANPKALKKFEKWYSKRPEYFERLSERAYWFLPYVLEQVEKRGMPTEVALLPAIESAFQPTATSRARAAGMWQFMGSTGRRFGLRQDWWMDGRRDLIQSTRAALDYLSYLSKEFNGDWELAFAAYNAGEGAVKRAMKRNRKKNKPTGYSYLSLSRETSNYVPKLLAVRNIVDSPLRYGITLKPIPGEHTLKIIDARSQTDLTVVASLAPVSLKQLQFLNRGYKRGVTPPSGPHTMVVPADIADEITAKLDQLSYREKLRWARHQVKEGEYLGKIARRHSVTVESIQRANQLSSTLIRPGQELKIPLSTGNYQYAAQSGKIMDIKAKDSDTIYVVKSGDSLWKIAQKTGTSLSKLLSWNGLSKRTRIYPGQPLIIAR